MLQSSLTPRRRASGRRCALAALCLALALGTTSARAQEPGPDAITSPPPESSGIATDERPSAEPDVPLGSLETGRQLFEDHVRLAREAAQRFAARVERGWIDVRRRAPPRWRPALDRYEDWVTRPEGRHAGLLAAALLLALYMVVRRRRVPADLAVSIEYPSELRGTFSVCVSRRKPSATASRRAREARKHSRSTKTERYMVSREAHFEGLRPGRYWVRLEGTLEDPEHRTRVQDVAETARVELRKHETVRLPFDLRPRGCPVEVRVTWDGRPVPDACVSIFARPDLSRYARAGIAQLVLPLGRHRLVVGSGDRVLEQPLEIDSHHLTTIEVELGGSTSLVFKACPPAVEPYLDGDLLRAAGALERDGQTEASHLLLARLHRANDQLARAAHHYEAAGHLREAAELRAQLSDFVAAAHLLERTGAGEDRDRAIDLLQQVSRDHDAFARARALLADLLVGRGDDQEALALLEEMASSHPDPAERENASGRIESLRKRMSPPGPHQHPTVPATRERTADASATAVPDISHTESRYDILEQIGRGGMGVVFKARDRRLGRLVALKQLPDNLRDHPTALRLFHREARAAAALNHPNIVTLYDADQEGGKYFITMELLEGRALNQIVRQEGRIAPAHCIRLGIQVASGLDYAHAKRIVHRDIKTANLFWTNERVIKIMDFGLSKMLEEVRQSSTVIGGTPYYVAPEQITGEGVDPRADIYAFGVTLFEMSTGEVPFRQGDVLFHHRNTPAPDPRERAPSLPPALAALISAMLEKDPAARPQTAREVGNALAAVEL